MPAEIAADLSDLFRPVSPGGTTSGGACDDGQVQRTARVRFRHHAALAVAALIALISAVPLLAGSPYLGVVLLVPLAVAVWAWRAGTDADRAGLTVRALLGSRRVPWSQVDAIATGPGRRVTATLVDGKSLALTAVTPADVPRLVAASGTRPATSSQ
jgi:hypothetical protein